METGLVLRPTNAVISGKMFGYGTYFADKARKSYGYTSGRGSYWANGSADEAIMALFDVHLGNSLDVQRRESWMGSLNETQLKVKGDYDSLFAKGGVDLINNEYITYNQDQSTIKFLIQLKG
jgi:poly [ADP-ribose] polymerase